MVKYFEKKRKLKKKLIPKFLLGIKEIKKSNYSILRKIFFR